LAALLLWITLDGSRAAAQTPPGRSVQIVITQPAPGATITGTEVLVGLATTGTVARDGARGDEWSAGGAFHVFLDGVDVLQTSLLRFGLQPVPPGPHRLRVELQDWPGGSAIPAEAPFTLVAGPSPAGASWWLAGIVVVLVGVVGGGLLLLWLLWVRP